MNIISVGLCMNTELMSQLIGLEFYEKMTGYYEAYYGKPSATRANWRVVYDTMDALNKRIKEVVNTDDELFIWQEKR